MNGKSKTDDGQAADTTHKQATEVPLFHSGLAYVAAALSNTSYCLDILMAMISC